MNVSDISEHEVPLVAAAVLERLAAIIADHDVTLREMLEELAERLRHVRPYPPGLDEALNSGDGTYRP